MITKISVPAPVPPVPPPAPMPPAVPPSGLSAPASLLPKTLKSLFRRSKKQPWDEVFAKFPYIPDADYDKPFRELANLAEDEPWSFGKDEFPKHDEFYILKNFLHHTFVRVCEQGRILFSEDGQRSCFNTGLLSKRGKDIYASFFSSPKGTLPAWTLWGFTDDITRLPFPSSELPLPASYYEGAEAANLVFDTSYEIDIDIDHILDDNKNRFPREYQDNAFLESALKDSIASLKKQIRRNYTIAIPHWYNGKIQHLLPLSLSGNDADLALVAERHDQSKSYKIKTVLTMDMAYMDARLICSPNRGWLKP